MESDSSAVEPCVCFASLPRFLALDIFARLPADARLLLALVSPSWRALVAEPSLWACVDLSEGSGVTRASDALLLACSAKAQGGMRSLDVCGRVWAAGSVRQRPQVSAAALVTTLQTNAHSLRHLRALCPRRNTGVWLFLNRSTSSVLDDLLHAAPGLTHIEVDISVDTFDASVLRNGVVSVRRLCLTKPPESFPACFTDAGRCLSLSDLELDMHLDAGNVEEVVDFAINKPLTALSLFHTGLTLAAMPSLTRLLSEGSLTSLELFNSNGMIEVLPPSQAFCAAVAAAPLVCLCYEESGLFHSLTAGLSLLAAVTRHPTVRHFSLSSNNVAPAGWEAVGAALGQLVDADSLLSTLDISACGLGTDGLLPFIDVLPRNTRLRRLQCQGNDFAPLTAARLLAAVRANASLIRLVASEGVHRIPDLVEAEALVAARTT